MSIKEASKEVYLIKEPTVDDLSSIVGEQSKELKNAFDVNESKREILLPQNIEEVMNNNYLYAIYFRHYVKNLKYKVYTLEKDYVSRYKESIVAKQVIQAFGYIFDNKKVPKINFPNSRVKRGIFITLKHYFSSVKNFPLDFYKFSNANHISKEVFGDPWGKAYPTEKRVLDSLIRILRSMKLDQSELGSYLQNDLIARKGLEIKISESLFSNFEVLYLKTEVKSLDDSKLSKDKLSKLSWQELLEAIKFRQIELKSIKSRISKVTDDRMDALYPRNVSTKQKKIRSEKKISTLIEELKGEPEFKAFNPSKTLRCYQKVSFNPSYFKNWDEKKQKMISSLVVTDSIISKNELVELFLNNFKNFINDLNNM